VKRISAQKLFYKEPGPFGLIRADFYDTSVGGELMWITEEASSADINTGFKYLRLCELDKSGSIFDTFVPDTADIEEVKDYIMLLLGALAEEV